MPCEHGWRDEVDCDICRKRPSLDAMKSVDELLVFAVLHAARYAREFGLDAIHPTHARIIDDARAVLGQEPISHTLMDI